MNLSSVNRTIRLRLWTGHELATDLLIVQQVSGVERICGGVEYKVSCVASRTGMPLEQFVAMPAELQFVTSTGGVRSVCGIVDMAQEGQSDGGLATYQLVIRDALAVMEKACNTRVFRNMNEVDITDLILSEWCRGNPALAICFDYELWRLKTRYPKREFTMQFNESDAAFLRRLWKRRGLAWFFQPAIKAEGINAPSHTLILFDQNISLERNVAEVVRYHRDDATETADSITAWSPMRHLIPGSVVRQSWDYKTGRMAYANIPGKERQGVQGDRLAAGLADRLIDVPHVGDDADDHRDLATARMLRHEYTLHSFHGEGGGRQWATGQWVAISGHPAIDSRSAPEREFVFTELRVAAQNNLPKTLSERAGRLFARNRWSVDDAPETGVTRASTERDGRYTVQFSCMRRDIQILPSYDPQVDLPRTEDMTVIVVGPPGESVHCDELGRVRVRFPGCRPEEREGYPLVADGVTEHDSAWVLVATGWAGAGFGLVTLPRVGTSAIVSFLGGDPDKPIIVNAAHSGATPPPRFDHLGTLPGDRYLSGLVSREVGGQRSNQLRVDDTPGQISVQLASDHAASQLNMGYLTHPRRAGAGNRRGDGFELTTNCNGSIRTAKALLISTWARLDACGSQLSAEEHVALLRDCAELFKSLGEVAAANQALAVDDTAQGQLRRDVEAGSGESPAETAKPTLSVSAAEGIAFSTPKTIVSYAGTNIDTVAQQHLQFTSGQRFALNAGRGISMFSHHDGIRQVAYHGKFVMQSQHDDMQIDAAQNLKATVGRSLTIVAQDEITLMVGGGAYLRLKGGNAEIGGPGPLIVKTDGHHWDGPASTSAELPAFGEGELGRIPRLLRPTDGKPVEGMTVKVQRDGEADITSKSDSAGETGKIVTNRLQRLVISFFGPRK